MKKYLIVVVMLFSGKCFAQQNFEGKIFYKAVTSDEKAGDLSLNILFGKNKIKVVANEQMQSGRLKITITILDFDSGKVTTITPSDSTFSIRKLKNKEVYPAPVKTQIAGYNVSIKPMDASFLGGSLMSNMTLYVSDSLLYKIPEKYGANQELIMVYHNKIVLGFYVTFSNDDYIQEDSLPPVRKRMSATAEAQQVIPMIIPDSEFEIPAGYKKEQFLLDHVSSDSVIVMADTTVAIPTPPPPPPHPTKKKPVKKTTPLKAPAVMRKP